MKFTSAILAALAATATATATSSPASSTTPLQIEAAFEAWREKHGVEFKDPVEYLKRLAIFGENMERIEEHNSKGLSWKMSMNEFGHLAPAEFKAMYSGFSKSEKKLLKTGGLRSKAYSDVPATPFVWKGRKDELADSVDWVDAGAVTAVKNQGTCGSCWSFSTTGAIEGAYYIANGKSVSLSEQQLVSCDTTNNGCGGGSMDYAFSWVESQGGLCSEADYPYASSSGTAPSCSSSCTVVDGTAPTGYTDVTATESSLMAAVSKQPVSIAIEADQSAFQFYSGGVMTGTCGTSLDHGVLLVGYGTEDNTDFWKVKNSWGSTWGEDGYIKIERGNSQNGGLCGILLSASYPTL